MYRSALDSGFAIRTALKKRGADDRSIELLGDSIDLAAKLVEESDRISEFLGGIDLTRLYAEICSEDRRISDSESASEVDRLIASKTDLLGVYDEYREKERRLAAILASLGRMRGIFIDTETRFREETVHERSDTIGVSQIEDVLTTLGDEVRRLLE